MVAEHKIGSFLRPALRYPHELRLPFLQEFPLGCGGAEYRIVILHIDELQDKVFVYRVIAGKAKSTPVEVTPLNEKKQYIVRRGLDIGETIVAEGVGLLQDGMDITIKE